jgi:hypothetical protein
MFTLYTLDVKENLRMRAHPENANLLAAAAGTLLQWLWWW